ncbi:MAG TPA: c-type cytochrome domain-containing protein, partial [Myxococcota bacterium]
SFTDAQGQTPSEPFHVPGTSRCVTCHGEGDKSRALGMRTKQLDVPGQIDRFVDEGVLKTAPSARGAFPDPYGVDDVNARGRAYLDVNCGDCHSKEGFAAGTKVRFDLAHLDTVLCQKTKPVDGRDRVIVPGHPEQSELLARMVADDPVVRMPQGVILRPDQRGLEVLSSFIASLSAKECP